MTFLSINGELVPSDQAQISAQDRGFRLGDGVFETIPVHQGIPYMWEYHMERLAEGLTCLAIEYPVQILREAVIRLIHANTTIDGVLRIAISRGVGSRGYLPIASSPTLVMEITPLPEPPAHAIEILLSSYEKISPRALPTHCKLAQGLGSTLARMQAHAAGYGEALQCDALGNIAEASSANIFWLKDGTLYTPSLATGALAGVTRRWLMEHVPFPVQEGAFPLALLEQAEAVILTNATQGIIPVRALHPYGWTWENTALAADLNLTRQRHITAYNASAISCLA